MKKHNFKVGDKVRIIGNGDNKNTVHHHFNIGDVGEIIKIDDDGDLSVVVDELRQIVEPEHVELIPSFKIGDKVRIIGNKSGIEDNGPEHYFDIGSVGKITDISGRTGSLYVAAGGRRQFVNPKHVELVHDEPDHDVFPLSEIKDGYLLVVEARNKRTYETRKINMTVVHNHFDKLGCRALESCDYWHVDHFNAEGVYDGAETMTLLAVYGRTHNNGLLANSIEDRELLWERKTKPEPVEMTVAEISEKLGFEVKIVK